MSTRRAKWNRWLDIIDKEITDLLVNRHIFWEVQKIIKSNPRIQKPSAFYEFLGVTYVASALMGVRRQVKVDKQSVSFARLLKEIAETPEELSRERFVSLYNPELVRQGFADRDFDKFAGCGGTHVDPYLARSHLDNLKTKVQRCEKYADRRVAHYDKRAMKTVPSFKDLDDSINFLEELAKKYLLLFRAAGLTSMLPVFQYDWKAIFKEAWLPN